MGVADAVRGLSREIKDELEDQRSEHGQNRDDGACWSGRLEVEIGAIWLRRSDDDRNERQLREGRRRTCTEVRHGVNAGNEENVR
jgi:hypothetical protein